MKEYLETNTDAESKEAKIRELNDRLRQSFEGGQIMLTIGFRALPHAIILKALKAIQEFDDFDEDNDPYGTHEFGAVEVEDYVIWFKIDAYDQNLEYGSPDPSDVECSKRVMTILLPHEY